MIIDLFLSIFNIVLASIFQFFPVVTIASLPLIGEFLRDTLVTIVTTWNAFLETFPYALVVWQVFLIVILPFEFLMLIGKLFLGSRMISHDTK